MGEKNQKAPRGGSRGNKAANPPAPPPIAQPAVTAVLSPGVSLEVGPETALPAVGIRDIAPTEGAPFGGEHLGDFARLTVDGVDLTHEPIGPDLVADPVYETLAGKVPDGPAFLGRPDWRREEDPDGRWRVVRTDGRVAWRSIPGDPDPSYQSVYDTMADIDAVWPLDGSGPHYERGRWVLAEPPTPAGPPTIILPVTGDYILEPSAVDLVLANPAAIARIYDAVASGEVTVARWSTLGARHIAISLTGAELANVFLVDPATGRHGARVGHETCPVKTDPDRAKLWAQVTLEAQGVRFV